MFPARRPGVVRRHPDIKWLRRQSDIASLASQAAAILDALWRMLAPGGKLLFVTCSVFRGETEHKSTTSSDAMRMHRTLRLPGIDTVDLQLMPDAVHDGFYYALLGRGA